MPVSMEDFTNSPNFSEKRQQVFKIQCYCYYSNDYFLLILPYPASRAAYNHYIYAQIYYCRLELSVLYISTNVFLYLYNCKTYSHKLLGGKNIFYTHFHTSIPDIKSYCIIQTGLRKRKYVIQSTLFINLRGVFSSICLF